MYKKFTHSWLKHVDFILIDYISLYVAFFLAFILRKGFDNLYAGQIYINMGLLLLLVNICAFALLDSLKNVLKRDSYSELLVTIKHVAVVELFTVLYLFAVQESVMYSRIILFMTGLFYFIITYISRCFYKKYYISKMQEGGKRSLLIITTKELKNSVIENIKNNNYELFKIAGIVIADYDMRGKAVNGIPVVANADTVVEYVCREWIDEIFINFPEGDISFRELRETFIEMGIVVHTKLWRSRDTGSGKTQFIEKMGPYTVLTTSITAASPIELLGKRVMDILGGIVGCLITLILVVLIGPIIYLKSPGPIFFAQERVGRNGKKFKMYKFRSMYLDAEERKKELESQNRVKDGMMFKLDFDPRIIGSKQLADGTIKKGIGNFIRDTSLDEFPQFFNILKGDMSLVGTRPPTVDEWEKYKLHHRARLSTKPGLTGMWQVSGRSNITDFEEVVRLDTQYIKEWNILLDIKILIKTVISVLKKEGSM